MKQKNALKSTSGRWYGDSAARYRPEFYGCRCVLAGRVHSLKFYLSGGVKVNLLIAE